MIASSMISVLTDFDIGAVNARIIDFQCMKAYMAFVIEFHIGLGNMLVGSVWKDKGV